jgi:multidrug efflux system outer membrane protein
MRVAHARIVLAIGAAAVAAACVHPPEYHRPAVNAPERFRGDSSPIAGGESSFGDARWFDVFQDDALRQLLQAAIAHNYDLQVAAARIVEARAQLGITHADQFPTVTAGAGVTGERVSGVFGGSAATYAGAQIGGAAAWDIDFWRKFRDATEAARAELVASEWGRRTVLNTLAEQVASAYFMLRALDLELDISTQTLASRRESLRLTEVRERGGATSLLDVRQAEQLVYGASAEIVQLQREIEQQENFISVLTGANPAPVARGLAIVDQPHSPDVPPGLPSALLERRPDVQRAESELVALNAQIGVARAAYFPSILLTGSGGLQSGTLAALVGVGTGIWTAAAAATVPVFTAGRIKSQVALAQARAQEAALNYQRVVTEAFREVSDALVGYRRSREFREQLALLRASAQDARRLAQIRYEGGATSYLEVLDADTRLFVAEIGLADAQLNELRGFVEIYHALGGGWQP